MSRITSVIFRPDRRWWSFWIPKQIELHEHHDFVVDENGRITFCRSIPNGQVEINYVSLGGCKDG